MCDIDVDVYELLTGAIKGSIFDEPKIHKMGWDFTAAVFRSCIQ